MPFRLDDSRAKIQFTSSAAMPSLIYRACLATGAVSNTVYCQHALAAALARDLNLNIDDILSDLPAPRGPAKHIYNPDDHTMARYNIVDDHTGGVVLPGPANTIEEVK